ncbi:uncharacterized protein EKO05_0006958 [Ascochyta rabiei]|uniref:Uncharacterized protein n=1 Tax=Didymella rabiei TaxID=5454 RepID=A0A162Z3U9_DIDRA|nr:uncharacterized protein EKO05_0006958 [Ascochyta rabiei]KZM20386.1 hypothetical protein ST47_g8476 [Ascochyta rabiei]UPX16564.1 hypothetical protein EKO05_0006958 [Ascochyta rabiei]
MPRHNTFKRRTQKISRSLIQKYLVDSDADDDVDQDTDHGDSPNVRNSQSENHERRIPKCASTENLLCCKAWLDQLCEHEQTLKGDSNWLKGRDERKLSSTTEKGSSRHDLTGEHVPMDEGVLQRIRDGHGPRDQIFDDLLAPLRASSPPGHGAETYDEMKKVLLAWDERMLGSLEEEKSARVMLKIASEKRSKLLEHLSYNLDEKQASDDASAELLHSLTALRPEIASFKNHDHPDVLLMSIARLELDMAEVERSEAKTQAFREKMRETAAKRLTDKVKNARRDLMHVKLKERQELTALQTAQEWAAPDKLSKMICWREQKTACDQEISKLQQALQQQVPELDEHIQATQSNAKALADMSASRLPRILEAGFSFEDESTSMPVEPNGSDLKTYLTGSLADILHAREEAAKMLTRMDTVGNHLEVLLDAAMHQYREYDGLSRLLNPAASLSTDGDAEVELAEKYGPRRESILLMIRGAQKAKDS